MSQQVLIIHPAVANSVVLKTFLEDLPDWTVCTANSLKSVLTQIIVSTPDLIILDSKILEVDEIEVLKAIKLYTFSSCPLGVFVDEGLNPSKHDCLMQLGISKIVYKPCNIQEVIKSLSL